MSLTKNQVASVAYTLTVDGQVVDQADKENPMAFIHGVGGMIPGFEKQLEGKSIGDSFSITVEAAEAYGERNDELTQDVSREMFEGVPDDQLVAGAQFQAQTDAGVEVITIAAVDGDNIKIDANHPLAGQTLNFDVEMLDIRDATAEELAHGHVHAAGGCGSHEEASNKESDGCCGGGSCGGEETK
ncbi:MAG: peptidylprolyl isomerase [Cocleimonas sp.]|nr:peptidylprolyl isomerase [Cocleimonas sp.]